MVTLELTTMLQVICGKDGYDTRPTMSVTLADGSERHAAYSIGSHDGEPMLPYGHGCTGTTAPEETIRMPRDAT